MYHPCLWNYDQQGSWERGGIEKSRVSTSDILFYSEKGKSKNSKPDYTNNILLVTLDNISLVTPEEKFVCNDQVITTSRDKGRTLVPDILRISTDHGYNIIGHNRKTLLTDEGSIKGF